MKILNSILEPINLNLWLLCHYDRVLTPLLIRNIKGRGGEKKWVRKKFSYLLHYYL